MQLKTDPLIYALNGGEDFELLFTIAPDKLSLLEESEIPCHLIGNITADSLDRSLILNSGAQSILQGGYNHFE
jgi:thiamine-monophosphate kinase